MLNGYNINRDVIKNCNDNINNTMKIAPAFNSYALLKLYNW